MLEQSIQLYKSLSFKYRPSPIEIQTIRKIIKTIFGDSSITSQIVIFLSLSVFDYP